MKKIIYTITLFSTLLLFNSCDLDKSKRCNDELEAVKIELENSKENIKKLEQKINGGEENIMQLPPSIGRGGKLKDGIAVYDLLIPVDFKVVSGPTFDPSSGVITHEIEPNDASSRYSNNNNKVRYTVNVGTSLVSIYIHSEIETIFGIRSTDDDPIEKKHRGSIIIGSE